MNSSKFMMELIGDLDVIPPINKIEVALNYLTARESFVIRCRCLDIPLSYKAIGNMLYETYTGKLGLTPERVRQIYSKAMRKLRHPSKSRYLLGQKEYIVFPKFVKEVYIKIPMAKSELATQDIRVLGLRTMYENALRHAGLNVVGVLTILKEVDLLSIRNFGQKGVSEIEKCLEFFGLKLRDD